MKKFSLFFAFVAALAIAGVAPAPVAHASKLSQLLKGKKKKSGGERKWVTAKGRVSEIIEDADATHVILDKPGETAWELEIIALKLAPADEETARGLRKGDVVTFTGVRVGPDVYEEAAILSTEKPDDRRRASDDRRRVLDDRTRPSDDRRERASKPSRVTTKGRVNQIFEDADAVRLSLDKAGENAWEENIIAVKMAARGEDAALRLRRGDVVTFSGVRVGPDVYEEGIIQNVELKGERSRSR